MVSWLEDRALRRAFQRSRENHGCSGADGVCLDEFGRDLDGALGCLRESVLTECYWAWPLRRVVVEKRPGSEETRTLLVAAVRDRVLQTAVAAYLEPYLEAEFNESSFGYRRGRSVRMAVERVSGYFREGYTWLVDADIDSFFDSVEREGVLGRLATLVPDETAVRLCRLWLDYAVWDGLQLTRPALGLPQGSVVSPMLANLCLDVLDDRLEKAGIRMVRYADDFVIVAKSRPGAERALRLTGETLEALRLRLHEGKTRIVRYCDGFRFLGVIFLKDLLATPWRSGERKRLKVISSAPPIPDPFFPDCERKCLRRYRMG